MSRYAIRRTPEPFDFLERWEVVELNCWSYGDRHRHVVGGSHFFRRKALKHLRRLETNQQRPEMMTSSSVPLTDLRMNR